jgi:hypothetical protein
MGFLLRENLIFSFPKSYFYILQYFTAEKRVKEVTQRLPLISPFGGFSVLRVGDVTFNLSF